MKKLIDACSIAFMFYAVCAFFTAWYIITALPRAIDTTLAIIHHDRNQLPFTN